MLLKVKYSLGQIENIVGKGENAGYQHFLLFPQCFLLRTKSVTKKEINKCMAEIYDPGGIRTRAARLISHYHNH